MFNCALLDLPPLQALLDIEEPPTSTTHVIRLAGGAELRLGTGDGPTRTGALPKGGSST